MKKVLFISGSLHQIPTPPKGTAIAQLIEDIVDGLSLDYHVQVISYKKEDFSNRDQGRFIQIDPSSFWFRFYFKVASIIPHNLNKRLWGRANPKFIAYFLCILPLLRKLKPDVIITSVHLDGFNLFRKRYGSGKHVFHFHSSNIELEGNKKLQYLSKNADSVLTLTQESADHLVKFYGMSANKVYPLPNAINLDVFNAKQAEVSRSENRASFGLGEEDFVLGYAGRLTLSKGIDTILICLGELQKEFGNVKLLVAGNQDIETNPDVEFKEELERVLKFVRPESIVFTGWLSRKDMVKFYSCVDVSILLSKKREGHSMFALESQSCGVPVIATRIGGNPEIIIHNESGFLIEPSNVKEELKFWLIKLITDRVLLSSLRLGAIRNVTTNFNYSLLLSRLRNVLRNL